MLCPLLLGLAASCSLQGEPYDPLRFERQVLATGFDRPMELEVAADGRIFVVEQGGEVLARPAGGEEFETVLELDVFQEQENGLLGVALDPDFDANGWIYLLYSPKDHMGQVLSRFVVDGIAIDSGSERVVMSWLEQRRECCHHGGSLEFDGQGNLFISTGDNTNPFGSSGFAPIDERPGRFPWDAQRTSADTMTFGGKVLRIRPRPDGGYDVPPGNLFDDPTVGRPEIYVMGCRNPWRISIDRETGYLYWGDVGPDAGGDGDRGSRGFDELNQAKGPGFFGWPLFIGDNRAYANWDFELEHLGPRFDPARPVNESPFNAGARVLPPAQPAWIWYPYGDSEEFPELGSGGRTACAGPVYHHDPSSTSPTRFPEELDGVLFFFEWSRHWIKLAHLVGDSELERLADFPGEHEFLRPVDMLFGPGGELFVLEYGSTWGTNEDSRLSRFDYVRGHRRHLHRGHRGELLPGLRGRGPGRHPAGSLPGQLGRQGRHGRAAGGGDRRSPDRLLRDGPQRRLGGVVRGGGGSDRPRGPAGPVRGLPQRVRRGRPDEPGPHGVPARVRSREKTRESRVGSAARDHGGRKP